MHAKINNRLGSVLHYVYEQYVALLYGTLI